MSERTDDTPHTPGAPGAPGAEPAEANLHASATAEPGAHLSLTKAPPPAQPESASAADQKKPRRGRVAVEFAECSLGEIINVSPTGLRARYKGSQRLLPEVDERFNMQVRTPDGPVAVRARVAWTKRVGFRKFDIGVEFIAADKKDAARLKQLASMAGRAIVINEATGGSKLRAG